MLTLNIELVQFIATNESLLNINISSLTLKVKKKWIKEIDSIYQFSDIQKLLKENLRSFFYSSFFFSFFTERKLHLVRWRGDCSWTPTTNDDAAEKINMNPVNRGIDIYSCEAESLKCHRFRRTIGQSFSALSSRKRMMMMIIIIVVAIIIIIII